MFPYFK